MIKICSENHALSTIESLLEENYTFRGKTTTYGNILISIKEELTLIGNPKIAYYIAVDSVNKNFDTIVDEINDIKKKLTFKSLFLETTEIAAIQNQQYPPHLIYAVHMSKLKEESGEFAQSLNKFIGTKKREPGETDEMIIDNAIEESVDQIQCIICSLQPLGVTPEMVLKKWKKKNKKYRKSLLEPSKN